MDAHALDDEFILYDSRADRAYVLNASATLLWESCEGSPTIDEAIRELAVAYDRDEADVAEDVVKFVRMARGAGLLLPPVSCE